METTLAIELKDVFLNKDHFMLGTMNLQIPKGYITAIAAPNGSGKSTTLQMIQGIEHPDRGEVYVLGERIAPEYSERNAMLRQKIGFVHETSWEQDNKVTGAQKAALHRKLYHNWNERRYEELLKRFEINDRIKLAKMSKGMRRKFDLVLSMAHNPELLILDEPSSGLDPLAWGTMIQMLHQFMEEEGRTILMTSHIIEEVKRLADFIVFMGSGRVIDTYEKDELLSNWFTLFINAQHLSIAELKQLPGSLGLEHTGGSTFRVTTKELAVAEQWCTDRGLQVISRRPLEMDEIMRVLVEQQRS